MTLTSPMRRKRPLLLACLATVALLAGCATAPAPTPAPEATTAPTPPPAPAAPAAPLPADAAPADAPVAPVAPVLDPLRPEVAIDLDAVEARGDLWVRLRRGFAMPVLRSERVTSQERWYASRPEYVQRMTERGSRYLFHIVEEVERRGMPTELALLPFIESAFNPQALSSAKASGMWQFMPSTGRHFDLTQNVFRDERRDVLASTRAALDYLGRLHRMFGDWHLALAAYNWGEGSVSRAIARNRKAGLPLDYESLRMPAETAMYVPKLQAVKNIVADPAAFGLLLPELANHPSFVAVPIERDIDVALAARLAGVPLSEFHALNPQMNKPVILAAGTPQLLLPYDNANTFVHALAAHRGPLASWTAWVVPKTLRPGDAAREVGMDESDLREVNRIPPRVLIKAGSTLLVPRTAQRQADVPERIADNASLQLAAEGRPVRRVVVKAGAKDSVASIARRYRVTPGLVAQWNGMGPSAAFKRGQPVVLYLAPAKAGGSKAARPAAGKRKAATSTRRGKG